MMNRFRLRPWLRYLEGTDGIQSGGTGEGGTDAVSADGEDTGHSDENGSASDDGGKGDDEGDVDEDPPHSSSRQTSEPAPKGEKADQDQSPEVVALKAQLEAQQKALDTLLAAHEAAAEKERVALATTVAKQFGLPDSLAGRLDGETREQLEADAKALAKDLGYRVTDPTQGMSGGHRATSIDAAVKAHYGVN